MRKPSPTFRFVALCCAVYFTSYVTRKCYEASILAICDDTGLARTAAGLGGTALVALYGAGQFATGCLADRIDPRRIVFAALLLTAACNAATPFAVGCGIAPLVALCALNGFAQAMFWPPLVKLFATSLPAGRYKGAVFAVNVAANIAIVAVFALVSACLHFAGWRLSFWLVAAAALAMAAAWRCCASSAAHTVTPLDGGPDAIDGNVEVRPEASSRVPRPPSQKGPSPLRLSARTLLPLMAAIAAMGAMRDGIETWAPSVVSDLCGFDAAHATLSVAVLPLFAVVSMAAARRLRATLGDEIRAALFLFAFGLAAAVALLATGGGTISMGIPLLAAISAAMHGVNLMLVCELPGRFPAKRAGAISGLLNACVYAGAAASIYGFAALHRHFEGWRPVFVLWIAALAFGAAAAGFVAVSGSRSGK